MQGLSFLKEAYWGWFSQDIERKFVHLSSEDAEVCQLKVKNLAGSHYQFINRIYTLKSVMLISTTEVLQILMRYLSFFKHQSSRDDIQLYLITN